MFRLIYLIALMSFIWLSACTPLSEFGYQTASNSGTPVLNVGGIGDLYRDKEIERVNVMVVHGMGGFPRERFEDLSDHIAGALGAGNCKSRVITITQKGGFDPGDGADRACPQNDKKAATEIANAATGQVHLRQYKSASSDKTINFYLVNWSFSVTPLKDDLLNIDEQDWIQDLRVKPFTNLAKLDFMNDRVADAFLYTGIKTDDINHVIDTTAKQIVKHSSDQNHRNAVIAISLGSAIVNNSIELGFEPRIQRLVPDFNANLCRVYLLANQIPLLQLGQETRTISTNQRYANMARGSTERLQNCPGDAPQWLAAISDPNDVLSYPLPREIFDRSDAKDSKTFSFSDEAGTSYADIALSIAKKKFGLLSVQFVNPIDAHANYIIDPAVRDILINGIEDP